MFCRQLQAITDFDDEVINDGARKGMSNGFHPSHLNRLSQLVTAKTKVFFSSFVAKACNGSEQRIRKYLREISKRAKTSVYEAVGLKLVSLSSLYGLCQEGSQACKFPLFVYRFYAI